LLTGRSLSWPFMTFPPSSVQPKGNPKLQSFWHFTSVE
jgi:hypothetical protein